MRWILLLALWLVPSATVQAQDQRLVGIWSLRIDEGEPQFDTALRLEAEGTFSLEGSGVFSGEALQDLSDDLAIQELLGDDLAIAFNATGTWDTEDNITISGATDELDLQLDGMDTEDFFDNLVRGLAAGLAEDFGIEEEERPAFEEEVVAQFNEDFSIEEFESSLGLGTLEGAYLLDGDLLRITDAEGDITEWERAPVSSAVQAKSWGQIKASRHQTAD